jgi:hypothetical protein
MTDVLAGGTGDGPAWIPIIGWYAVEIQHRSPQEAAADPTLLHNVMRDASLLFRPDAHVIQLDEALIAGAAGAELEWAAPFGRPATSRPPWSGGTLPQAAPEPANQPAVGVLLEVQRRIRSDDAELGLAVVMPGPAQLASALAGEDVPARAETGDADSEDALDLASQMLAALVRRVGEVGVDCLIFEEPGPFSGQAIVDSWAPLRNLARYYGCPIVLVDSGQPPARLPAARARDLGADAVVMPASAWSPSTSSPVIGIGLRDELREGGREAASLVAETRFSGWRLASTLGAVAPDTRLERVLAFVEAIGRGAAVGTRQVTRHDPMGER